MWGVTVDLMNYNDLANIYARNRAASSFVVDELRRGYELVQTSKVLEVGCGTGSYIRVLAEAINCSCWGVDPSERMMHQSRSAGKVQFVAGRG